MTQVQVFLSLFLGSEREAEREVGERRREGESSI